MRLPQRKVLKIFLALFLAAAGLLFVRTAFAQFGVNEVGNVIALQAGDPRIIAARIVRYALGFIGLIALVIVLYGGFVWMTSAGNEEKITKAKKILTNGIIGLVIIAMAFGITQYVLNTLMGITPGGGGVPTGPPVIGKYSGALGNSIIDSHYPPRGGTGIARNTKIIITFKEPMLLSTLINNYNDTDGTVVRNDNGTTTPTPELPDPTADDWMEVNSGNVRIFESLQGETGAGGTLNYLQPNQVRVEFTSDRKTFTFKPILPLGSPSQEVGYTVALKGANPPAVSGLKKADGTDAFAGAFSSGYAWDFQVSTFIDNTPPQITDVIPWPDSCPTGGCARNILVQINFNEAMDPTTVSGKTTDTPAFDKLQVKVGDTVVAGSWAIGNQYRTVEFTTNDLCGTNSCGGDIFCLPPDSDLTVTVNAATLANPDSPEARWEYDGATDVCGNSLDGGGGPVPPNAGPNGKAEGPPADDYVWTFRTSAFIDNTPPVITDVEPSPGEGGVTPLDRLVKITFNKQMSVTSFNTDSIILDDNERDACAVWFTLESEPLDSSGAPMPTPRDDWHHDKDQAIISHGDFIQSIVDTSIPAPACSDTKAVDDPGFRLVYYYPRVTQDIRDIYQNCFFEPVGPSGPGGGSECIEGKLPSETGYCSTPPWSGP